MKISKEDACNFLLTYQKLTDSQTLSGVDGILEYMKKVGCIQYDPLNIIGRNTDLVLQSRVRDYKPKMLEQLLYEDRLLVDGWDKMMAIYPREDWPYFHFVRQQRAFEAISTLRHRKSEHALHHIDMVLDTLSKNGPMQSKQIQLGSAGCGRWGHRNLSSAAMDYLFHLGKVGVFNKIGVNKVYDLIENLLPDNIINEPNPFKSKYDFMKWYVYRRLGSVGMLWNKNGGGWLATLMPDKALRQQILDEYIADGLVTCIEVEDISEKFYVKSSDVYIFDLNNWVTPKSVRFIAPLDNLMWDRDMLFKLFDFKYTWEVYIPVSKRKYGYYVIPVLFGNRFIARFEPEKSQSHIKIKNWWWEKDISVSNDMIDLSILEMERLAICFNKKEGIASPLTGGVQLPSC
jgi:uncharacterized protein YcaQ